MIVLNGEPFIRYWLRAVYPWAHQILVVEGATLNAAGVASPEGHSTDGTLDTIREFQASEDIQQKVALITAEDEGYPNGFWPREKTEMCQAFARRSTGDFLVTLGVDEFLLESDFPKVIKVLEAGATHVCFNAIDFWADISYRVDGFWNISHPHNLDRIMAWGNGYRYVEHRPPTVLDSNGTDVRNNFYVSAERMERQGVYLYHFSHLFPSQIVRKSSYYVRTGMYQLAAMELWANECYLRLCHPFRVHNVYRHMSWLERYDGSIPLHIVEMMNDIRHGCRRVETRTTEDVEQLLGTTWYPNTVRLLRFWARFITTHRGQVVYRLLNSIYIRLPRLARVFDSPF